MTRNRKVILSIGCALAGMYVVWLSLKVLAVLPAGPLESGWVGFGTLLLALVLFLLVLMTRNRSLWQILRRRHPEEQSVLPVSDVGPATTVYDSYMEDALVGTVDGNAVLAPEEVQSIDFAAAPRRYDTDEGLFAASNTPTSAPDNTPSDVFVDVVAQADPFAAYQDRSAKEEEHGLDLPDASINSFPTAPDADLSVARPRNSAAMPSSSLLDLHASCSPGSYRNSRREGLVSPREAATAAPEHRTSSFGRMETPFSSSVGGQSNSGSVVTSLSLPRICLSAPRVRAGNLPAPNKTGERLAIAKRSPGSPASSLTQPPSTPEVGPLEFQPLDLAADGSDKVEEILSDLERQIVNSLQAISPVASSNGSNGGAGSVRRSRLQALKNKLTPGRPHAEEPLPHAAADPSTKPTTRVPATFGRREQIAALPQSQADAETSEPVSLSPFHSGIGALTRDELNALWQDFVRVSEYCGRSPSKLRHEAFRQHLLHSHESFCRQLGVERISFKVKVKDGKPALIATPIGGR